MKNIPWQQHILMIPGPTPVPPEALQAAGQPMMNHRGPEFKAMIEEIEKGLKEVFLTKSTVGVLTGSGTAAMEAALVNVLSPNDKILACPTGVFGDRWIKIAKAYGADVEILETTPGEGVDPEKVKSRLRHDEKNEIKAILVTHNETSTAVENRLKEISESRGDHQALMLVDSVSGLGASELRMDAWKIDVVAAASQKALMAPPGLAYVAMSERAWEANKKAKMPRFYLDLAQARDFQSKGQTPFTPGLSTLYAQQAALRLLLERGVEWSFAHHKKTAKAVQTALETMGLKLFAHSRYRSNTVTAVEAPLNVDVKKLQEILRTEYGIVIAGGQGQFAGKVFRVGHMGFIGDKEVLYALVSLGKVLREQGVSTRIDEAVKAFIELTSNNAPTLAH